MLTNAEAVWLGNEALVKHGLAAQGWTFRLNTNRSRLGVCKFDRVQRNRFTGETRVVARVSRIEISIYCVAAGLTTFHDTLLHEVAHALVGAGHGHGPVWKAKAREIGCTAMRCGVMDAPAKYTGTCPSCNATFKRNRITKDLQTLVHGPCHAKGLPAKPTWKTATGAPLFKTNPIPLDNPLRNMFVMPLTFSPR
jgi:hypothetical protein